MIVWEQLQITLVYFKLTHLLKGVHILLRDTVILNLIINSPYITLSTYPGGLCLARQEARW